MSIFPPLIGYMLYLLGSLAGVGVLALISWLQLSPTWWFRLGSQRRFHSILIPEPGLPASAPRRWAATDIALLAAALPWWDLLARGSSGRCTIRSRSRSRRRRHGRGSEDVFTSRCVRRPQGDTSTSGRYTAFRGHVSERASARRRFRSRPSPPRSDMARCTSMSFRIDRLSLSSDGSITGRSRLRS